MTKYKWTISIRKYFNRYCNFKKIKKEIEINDNILKSGITKINSIARLQEIKRGKLKDLAKNNKLFVDGSHNPLGAKVLNEYLASLEL